MFLRETEQRISAVAPSHAPTALFYIHLTILQQSLTALIDSGASGNFVNIATAQRLGCKRYPLKYPVRIHSANGQSSICAEFIKVRAYLTDFNIRFCLRVVEMAPPLILGLPFLTLYDPLISWRMRTMQIKCANRTHDVPIISSHSHAAKWTQDCQTEMQRLRSSLHHLQMSPSVVLPSEDDNLSPTSARVVLPSKRNILLPPPLTNSNERS